MDSYDISDLLGDLAECKGTLRFMSLTFAFVLGAVYAVAGLCFWPSLVRERGLLFLVFGTLGALSLYPVLLFSVGVFCRFLLIRWPLCPVCGGKLAAFQAAFRRCPRCRSVIAHDRRKFIDGYVLPDLKLLMVKPQSCSLGSSVVQISGAVILTLLAFASKFILDGDGEPDLAVLSGRLVFLCGVIASGVIIFGQFAALKAVRFTEWLDRRFDKVNRKLDKNYHGAVTGQEHTCPHCGKMPYHKLTGVTGNCTHCGAEILKIEPEPDTPEMMDGRKLSLYWKLTDWETRAVFLLWIPLVILISVFSDHVFYIIPVLIIEAEAMLLKFLRRRWRLNFVCPHCQSRLRHNRHSMTFLRSTGHCAECLRRIVSEN